MNKGAANYLNLVIPILELNNTRHKEKRLLPLGTR